jgi:hypothetical protein
MACRLDLSENKLDSVSAHALSAFLRDPNCGLQELYLGKGKFNELNFVVGSMSCVSVSACPYCNLLRQLIDTH